jgi:hypothetical protein
MRHGPQLSALKVVSVYFRPSVCDAIPPVRSINAMKLFGHSQPRGRAAAVSPCPPVDAFVLRKHATSAYGPHRQEASSSEDCINAALPLGNRAAWEPSGFLILCTNSRESSLDVHRHAAVSELLQA